MSTSSLNFEKPTHEETLKTDVRYFALATNSPLVIALPLNPLIYEWDAQAPFSICSILQRWDNLWIHLLVLAEFSTNLHKKVLNVNQRPCQKLTRAFMRAHFTYIYQLTNTRRVVEFL